MKYLFDTKTIKQAREEAGFLQADAAQKLGITVRQYIRWEAGESALKPYQIEALKALFINKDVR